MPDIDLELNTKQKIIKFIEPPEKKGAVQNNNKGSYNEIM